MRKEVECARALLPISDLALTGGMGTSAFHAAVMSASDACFELMLAIVSDVDVRTLPGVDPNGQAAPAFNMTALHIACDKGQASMRKALLSQGADRMARDSNQLTPLHWAAHWGHLSCVVMLVGRPGKVRMTPAEVDAVEDKGWTALYHAAQQGHYQICGVLLGAGARLDAKTLAGSSPIMIVRRYQPTNAALLALLSGDGMTQPPGLVCDHCGLTAEAASVKALKACAKCYVVHYSGQECQLAAWPGHKEACKARAKELEEKAKLKVVET